MRRRDDGEQPPPSTSKRGEKEEQEHADEEEESSKEEKLKVVVRIRPLQKNEEPWPTGRTVGNRIGHQTDDAVDLRIERNSVSWEKNGQLKTLLADAVFQGDAAQDDVFHSVEGASMRFRDVDSPSDVGSLSFDDCADCIDGLLAGFDCSVFA
ncbi:hypothetical protein PINS_up003640 [Pythium insidiosum]|nr:hypothetical protein PINS_up003640 [Pythium insidiosum]